MDVWDFPNKRTRSYLRSAGADDREQCVFACCMMSCASALCCEDQGRRDTFQDLNRSPEGQKWRVTTSLEQGLTDFLRPAVPNGYCRPLAFGQAYPYETDGHPTVGETDVHCQAAHSPVAHAWAYGHIPSRCLADHCRLFHSPMAHRDGHLTRGSPARGAGRLHLRHSSNHALQ